MNNITITTEFSKEDRALLQSVACSLTMMGDVASSLTLLATVLGNMQPPAVQQQIIQEGEKKTTVCGKPLAGNEEPTAEPVAEETAPIVDESAVPEVKPVSFPEFRKAVTVVCAKGPKQKAAAKELINKYATSVSAVPEDKRAEVMAELAKI